MSTRMTITGILSGAALGLGLVAAGPSAHASRASSHATEVEAESRFDCHGAAAGASLGSTGDDGAERGDGPGTQGRSNSDPDGDANGGADKPGCDGGFGDDRDGNNGCGNDDDFEDDNNGRCGGRATSDGGDRGPETDDDAGEDAGEDGEEDGPSAEVAATAAGLDTRVAAGTTTTDPGATTADAADGGLLADDEPRTEVLGVTEEQPDTLPRTGAGVGALAAAAGLCLGGGRLVGAVRRLLGA